MNRNNYSGISILPHSDHSYKQAPFEDCTKEKYDELFEKLTEIDLSKVVETTDDTSLADNLACGGGSCEII